MNARSAAIATSFALGCGINPAFDPLEGTGDGSTGDGAILLHELRAAWSTPNQIRWVWEVEGEESDFVAYELVLGPTEQDVLDRSAATTLFDATRNPELGVFIVPRTFQALVVEATTTDLLATDTTYYAQLHVRDTAGTASTSNVAIGRTNPLPNYEIVLLAEGDSPGYSIPASYVVDTVAPYAGAEHFSYVHVCGMPTCSENLQRQDLVIDLAEIRRGDFETTAYVEFAASLQDSIPWWYGGVYFFLGGQESVSTYSGWQMAPDGVYRLIQAPLDAFVYPGEAGPQDDVPMLYEDLAPGLTGFMIGGHWSEGATVRIDEVRIRW